MYVSTRYGGDSDHIFVNGRVNARMYYRGMEKRIAISIKLPPELLREIDTFCGSQVVRPTRTALIEKAVRSLIHPTTRKVRT